MRKSKTFYLTFSLLLFSFLAFGNLGNPLKAEAATYTYSDNGNVGLLNGSGQGDYFPLTGGTLPTNTQVYFTSSSTVAYVCQIITYHNVFRIPVSSYGGGIYGFMTSSSTDAWSSMPLIFSGNACLNGDGTYDPGVAHIPWDVASIVITGTNITFTTAPPTPPASVSLAYPTSTTPDFSNWVVSWSGYVPYGTMEVVYGLSSTTLNYTDPVSFDPFISANPLPIHKSQPLWFPPLAIPVTWYAQVLDMGATSTVYSDIISFPVNPNASNPASSTITNAASPFYGVPGTSSTLPTCNYPTSSFFSITDSAPFFQINDPVPYISASFCGLFIPTPEQQTNLKFLFSNLQTTYGKKPPFGYLTAISTPLQGLTISPSSEWPELINASTSAEYSIVWGTLDTSLATILYILLGVWVFHKARTIQL
jgi:hypothetical protein